MDQRFYQCNQCGNTVAFVWDSGAPIVCCNEEMAELVSGTVDASPEKHVPVYEVEGNIVRVHVGEAQHPMLAEHHIEWISIQTKQGNQRKELPAWGKPEACFALLDGDEVEAAYAYCNLHGLWRG